MHLNLCIQRSHDVLNDAESGWVKAVVQLL